MLSIIRSGPFRIALIFAATVTITTYLVFAVVYLHYYASNVALVRSVLLAEAQDVADIPSSQLKQQLALRLTQDLRLLDFVGLYDAQRLLLFGNMAPGLDVPVDADAHLYKVPPPRHEGRASANAVFVAVRRHDGGALVLGRSLIYADGLERVLLKGSVTALTPVVLIALAVGALVSRRASRRLVALRGAIQRVMNGEVHVRLPARGTVDDIDELVCSVNQMLDEISRLLQQMRHVGDNIAHDLRAPLAVMRSRLERGLAGQSEQDLRELVGEALRDLERAMTTVTALLRISELESGLRRSAFDEVDLRLVARDAFDLFKPLADVRTIALHCQVAAPLLVMGDGDLLREALANLVDNAIKFTPPGGRVTIACGVGDALMSVSDTGCGIAVDERRDVLKRFHRGRATQGIVGSGLGLSMTGTIIDLHGFALRFRENSPGTIVEITLAMDAERGSTTAPAHRSAA